LLHHPHLHCVVPGGGISPDGTRWVPCKPGFFLHVRVLSLLFRRLFLEQLQFAFDSGRLQFFNSLENIRDRRAFVRYLEPLKKTKWVVYAKRPFAGPEQVLDYVGRYTHRVAISNNRLLAIEAGQVNFGYKDYRNQGQQKAMTLSAEEFIRRFLLHALPHRFHRIRYYGFCGNRNRQEKLTLCRQLLGMTIPKRPQASSDVQDYRDRSESLDGVSLRLCPLCRRGRMVLSDTLVARRQPALKDTS